MNKLTEPQRRMLANVRIAGAKTYNERARRTVEALEKAGFVSVEWHVMPDALRGRHQLRATVTPK